MKSFTLNAVIVFLVLMSFNLQAQTTDTNRITFYRKQPSEIQQKIDSLSSVANTSVYMPVLFGVGINNISPNFGTPRSNGRTHQGEDIMAVKGTPVISPTPAVVLRTGTGVSEGFYVYTANPGGETFGYVHLDRIGEGVVPGTVLSQGSLIGYVGNTGNASGGSAHLHFEIHDSSYNPVDPFPRLNRELSLQEKMTYLSTILNQTSDSVALSQFLVLNFRSNFTSALSANVTLPQSIVTALSPMTEAVVTPVAPPRPATSSVNTPLSKVTLLRNLSKGMSGTDVKFLQRALNARGYIVAASGVGSIGNETTYFGAATTAAVIKFQIAERIKPALGYVGSLTRGALER